MSEDNANLLMKAAPDNGPARIIIALIATVIAVSTTAATGLFGADKPIAGASCLFAGLVLGLLIFFYFKVHILGRTCFKAALPFELDIANAQEARKHLEKLQMECQKLITTAQVRANIFRPSPEFQQYGCACVLKIDPQLEAEMSHEEVQNIRFLPGQGHTGKAFMSANMSCGEPTVAITREQLANVSPNLAYIISWPLSRNSCILGVLNIDFCTRARGTDENKKVLIEEVKTIQEKIVKLMEKAAPLITAQLAKGKLQSIWLLTGL